MDELVYFVDVNDNATGEIAEKLEAHDGETKLHAAFSCYVFDEKGRFLVTKRASTKKVWPSVWTNSCCGHPKPDETREDAITRRLDYELGMKVKGLQEVITNYIYKTPPYNGIIEHEYCPVYVAIADSSLTPNPTEVDEYAWMDWEDFVENTEVDSDDYSNPGGKNAPEWAWWCKDQLKHLKTNKKFDDFLNRLIS